MNVCSVVIDPKQGRACVALAWNAAHPNLVNNERIAGEGVQIVGFAASVGFRTIPRRELFDDLGRQSSRHGLADDSHGDVDVGVESRRIQTIGPAHVQSAGVSRDLRTRIE